MRLQAAQALAAKEEAQQAVLAERLRREAAERRAQQVQEDLDGATRQLQAAAAQAAAAKDQDQREAAERCAACS